MNDKFYDSDTESVDEEDYDEPIDYDREKKKFFTSQQMVFAAMVASLLVLVILIGAFVLQRKFTTHVNQVRKLETRIKQFETKLTKLEEISKPILQLEKQVENFTLALDRIDQFETSMSLRLDALNRQLTSLQNKTIAMKQVDSAIQTASKNSDNTKVRHHIVQPGETLYKISRQYGLAVEQLRSSNTLEANSVIYPGQKLIIGQGKKDNE